MALQTHIRSSDTIFSAPGTVSALQDIIGNSSASVEVTQSKCLKFSSKKKKKKITPFLLSDIWSVYMHLISSENNYRILPILKRKEKKSSLFFFNLLND